MKGRIINNYKCDWNKMSQIEMLVPEIKWALLDSRDEIYSYWSAIPTSKYRLMCKDDNFRPFINNLQDINQFDKLTIIRLDDLYEPLKEFEDLIVDGHELMDELGINDTYVVQFAKANDVSRIIHIGEGSSPMTTHISVINTLLFPTIEMNIYNNTSIFAQMNDVNVKVIPNSIGYEVWRGTTQWLMERSINQSAECPYVFSCNEIDEKLKDLTDSLKDYGFENAFNPAMSPILDEMSELTKHKREVLKTIWSQFGLKYKHTTID